MAKIKYFDPGLRQEGVSCVNSGFAQDLALKLAGPDGLDSSRWILQPNWLRCCRRNTIAEAFDWTFEYRLTTTR